MDKFFSSVEILHSEVLGVGSYGKVCKAKYGQLPCAAKLLHDTMIEDGDPGRLEFSKRFEQECQFLSVIKHPNIVQCLGTCRDLHTRRLALLMEQMDESLTKYLERSTDPLPYHIQVNVCLDVALALSYLHSKGIIHRDLSSNNVLLIGEGSRAKVTDFGMSKLMSMNPHSTQLTLCPGAMVYIPPEALTTPPSYSTRLDCFSYGVLAIQVITRKFPNPGDAHKRIEDPHFPTQRLLRQVPEVDRRKLDIDCADSNHPLLPTALLCLKDSDVDRPSADEVCQKLTTLQKEERYVHSLDKTKQQLSLIQRLQDELNEKTRLILNERTKHQEEVRQRDELIEICQTELAAYQSELKEKDQIIQNLMAEIQRERAEVIAEKNVVKKDQVIEEDQTDDQKENTELVQEDQVPPKESDDSLKDNEEIIEQLLKELEEMDTNTAEDHDTKVNTWFTYPEYFHVLMVVQEKTMPLSAAALVNPIQLSWKQVQSSPQAFTHGGAVVQGSTAFFSYEYEIYSFTVPENKWRKLQRSKYRDFSMIDLDGKLTTIGGYDGSNVTNILQSIVPGHSFNWSEVLPPMPTKRRWPAAVTTLTYLVVAGGWSGYREGISKVEILDIITLQWSAANNLPISVPSPQLKLCGGYFYLAEDSTVMSCSVEDLLRSSKSNSGSGSVWTMLTKIPVQYDAFLLVFREQVMAIGGESDLQPTAAIHYYDRATNSWSVVGEIPSPQARVLAAVLPDNKLLVAGGFKAYVGSL